MDTDALKPILAGIVRHGLTALGGTLVASGYLQSSDVSGFIGAGMVIAGIVWSWWQKDGQRRVVAALAKMKPVAAPDATEAQAVKAANDALSKAVQTTAKVLLVAFGLSVFLAGVPAHAQGGKTAPAAKSANGKVVTKAAAVANPITVLQTFTVSDLQAALADAQANNDIAASNCYSALLPIIQSGVANPFPTGLGGFQLLQKARDAKALAASLQSPNGPLATLNMACAPLVLDVQSTLIQLGIIGGGVAITAGTGGLTLPALPALIPGL